MAVGDIHCFQARGAVRDENGLLVAVVQHVGGFDDPPTDKVIVPDYDLRDRRARPRPGRHGVVSGRARERCLLAYEHHDQGADSISQTHGGYRKVATGHGDYPATTRTLPPGSRARV